MNSARNPSIHEATTMRPNLRSLILPLALAGALGAAGTAQAQSFAFGWNPRTGDMWIDSQLSDINRYGTRYRDPFIDEIVRYHGAPRYLVSDLLLRRRWAPGDVYFACALAQVAGRPCRAVVTLRDRAPAAGWAALAAQLGVGADGDAYRRLRGAIGDSYQRWARPLPDAE